MGFFDLYGPRPQARGQGLPRNAAVRIPLLYWCARRIAREFQVDQQVIVDALLKVLDLKNDDDDEDDDDDCA